MENGAVCFRGLVGREAFHSCSGQVSRQATKSRGALKHILTQEPDTSVHLLLVVCQYYHGMRGVTGYKTLGNNSCQRNPFSPMISSLYGLALLRQSIKFL